MVDVDLRRVTNSLWTISPTGGMRVPAPIYAMEDIIADIVSDEASEQVANVAEER